MREILFRGKRADNGEWVEGGLFVQTENDVKEAAVYVLTPSLSAICNAHLVIPETVGQYTGLTDKKGTKIFEGDIVKIKHGYCGNPNLPTREYVEAVHYNPNSCCYDFYRWSGDIYSVEVIGNIHDNPELLKGAQE